MIRDWQKILADVDSKCMFAAAADIVSTGKSEWPPPIGVIRCRALDLNAGELAPISPYEAWGRVSESIGKKSDLTELEKLALNNIGGTWTLKNGDAYTMSHFLKAYQEILDKERRLRTVLPAVSTVAARNTPSLPEPVSEKPLELEEDGGHTACDPESISELLRKNGY